MIDWKEALKYAELVRVAELVEPGADYGAGDIARLKDLGYTFLTGLYASDLSTEIDPHLGDVVSFGFLAIAEDDWSLVAAVRGTDTILEWIHDAEFLMVPGPKGATEDGFTSLYRSLRDTRAAGGLHPIETVRTCGLQLAGRPISRFVSAGHSLGAALATLLAAEATEKISQPVSSWTFASPRVGDWVFWDRYGKVVKDAWRVENRHDLVPNLPPFLPLPYRHVGEKGELKPGNLVDLTIPCQHHLTTYLALIAKEAGIPGYSVDEGCRP